VRFGAAASVPADGVQLADAVFIPANLQVTVAPQATSFTVIRYTADGTLIAQCIDKWAGLALQTQYNRR
jgi:hypothetical protein